MIGTKILHYQIDERLGEGGMGVVYRATDTKLGRHVALKFLPAFVSERKEEKERFLREARTASLLDHPNIATIYEVNESDGKLFYAMSLVEGVTLKDLRRQGPVTNKQIIQIATQIADGLAHAHDRDIVHRDIKPQNIMVTTEGRAMILDFGLARRGTQESLSGTTSTAGTAAYISPEQAQGQPATAASDLFSLGVVLYELVAGEAPFKGDHPAAVVYSIVHEDPPPVLQVAPETPPALAAIIESLLAKDPAKRPASAAELAESLRRVARELEFSSFSGSVRTLRRESRMGWRSLAFAAVVVLALGVWAASLLEDTPGDVEASVQYDLAVMYFNDLSSATTEQRTGEMITELIITDLSRSPYLRVLSSQRLYDILKQLDREGQTRIDQNVASDIARRARARTMITGSIATAGDRTRLTANLIEVRTGELIRAEQVEGTDLFAMVDSLSARLTDHIAASGDIPADSSLDLSVAEATTSDPRAYIHYITGLEQYHKLEWDSALAQFDSAIALDSGFGLAYLRAGVASFSHNQAGRGYEYLTFGRRALEEGSLPPRESLLVQAFSYIVEQDAQGAIGALSQLIERFPDDKEALFWRGTFLRQSGESQAGIEDMLASLELDPTYPFALINLIDAYEDLDNIPGAITMAERYRTIRPDEVTPHITLAGLYIRVEQLPKARQEIAEALRLDPQSYAAIATLAGYFGLTGHIDSIRTILEPFLTDTTHVTHLTVANERWGAALFLNGRFSESFAQYRHTAELEQRYGDSLQVAGHLMALAVRHNTVGETDSARQVFNRAYKIFPQQLRFSQILFEVALTEGDFEEAGTIRDKLLDRLAKVINEEQLRRVRTTYDAQMEFAAGNYRSALRKFNSARLISGDPDDFSFLIGRAYLETGRPDSARAELERSILRYGPFHPRGYWQRSYYYLGKIHEALGNRGDAAKSYRTFLRYWGRADRPLPEVADAKERLSQLSSAS
jgi:non-specific serine/threonine protein kinase